MDEKLLITLAQHGDVDAFGELYRGCYKKLYQYALYMLRNAQDAEDIVSETVTDAFAQITRLKNTDSFYSWIYSILINKCKQKRKDYLQKALSLTEELQMTQDYARSMEAHTEGTSPEEQMDVRNCLFDLPEDERMIISMNVILGYPTVQIAKAMGINDNTVRSKKSRALAKLRKTLKEETRYA